MGGEVTRICIDPRCTAQTIEGFGANLNPVGHWRQGSLAPVLDTMVDELGATLFRVDPYGVSDWVGEGGPEVLCRGTYERAYGNQDFQDAWATIRHLQSRGCTTLLNVSGPVPQWMCRDDGVTLAKVEEYVEMLRSLVEWAVREEEVAVPYVGPLNETDIGPPEGPFADPKTALDVVRRLRERLDESGFNGTKIVGFDQARWDCKYLERVKAHSVDSSPIDVLGMHCYHDDADYESIGIAKEESGLADASLWLTEYGDLDGTGERELDVALASTRRLLRGLRAGVNAGIVWDAFDNWHRHEGGWTLYGLMRTAVRGPIYRYTKKRRYFAAQQVFQYVKPGWRQVSCSGGDAVSATAFASGSGDITIVGVNLSEEPKALDVECDHSGGPPGGGRVTAPEAAVFVTSSELDCEQVYRGGFAGSLKVRIPPRSVFTIATGRI